MNDQVPDREVMQGLSLGNNRAKVYQGEVDVLLTLGPVNAVPVEDGVRHRHLNFPDTIEHERDLAHWLGGHWFSGKRCLVRAEPLVNGSRVVAMLLMQLGSDETEALRLLNGGER